MVDQTPLGLPNDVDVASNGVIYFSDASTKFTANELGGPYRAFQLDLLEHGGHGRLLAFYPDSGEARTLLEGIHFANGVAVGHDQTYVLVVETELFRILRYWVEGPKKGQSETFSESLPAYPDNLSRGSDGRCWVAMPAPRSKLLEDLADKPFARKLILRMPSFLHPKPIPYSHIIAIDEGGQVVEDMQDPDATYPTITSVTETERFLYLGNKKIRALGRKSKSDL